MAGPLREGDKIPFFRYDTPYSAQNRLRDLLREQAPLVLIFMSNFGHPVTRVFAARYAATRRALKGANFALVVRSRADKLAASIGPDSLPYPLLCDAEGVLYEHFGIPERRGTLMTYSLEGWRILNAAKKQGYRPPKNTPEQLPLTLVLDADCTVLFCHYGASLTDVPTDCAALQSLLEELELDHPVPPALTAAAPGDAGKGYSAPPSRSYRPARQSSAPPDEYERMNGDFIHPGDFSASLPSLPQEGLDELFRDPYEDD